MKNQRGEFQRVRSCSRELILKTILATSGGWRTAAGSSLRRVGRGHRSLPRHLVIEGGLAADQQAAMEKLMGVHSPER